MIYSTKPAYKIISNISKLSVLKSYTPDLILWGGAGLFAVATFTDGIPKFKDTFYSKIPYVGDHWQYHPDPEDVSN
ncbi:ubiquinol--cytochrome-c reductase subunit 10 ASCRUDRAFT_77808 [Ascoidea rubescens DSM 1968]|uniref:Cytochrome b-c1 complex subunit 10 n=1 Tax=Ascoidea rubescens DSM 1968 TaxID=1344418 RepID=A0A1D2VA49_9ASCO|nr:hypothetical protein ASCRUDRAFT_77808 [Ascoidea rubescens DSM 1968]ODV58556.1 hypothetical protein ASCRUDRAFT_77808 [Ascoidea rubescens DSM 1968]